MGQPRPARRRRQFLPSRRFGQGNRLARILVRANDPVYAYGMQQRGHMRGSPRMRRQGRPALFGPRPDRDGMDRPARPVCALIKANLLDRNGRELDGTDSRRFAIHLWRSSDVSLQEAARGVQ